MRSTTDLILARLSRMPDVARLTAEFVQMVGPLAKVNIGQGSVDIPCVGFTPPIPGMIVQVERRNGELVVIGPAVTLNPIGVISATGSPKCTVTIDGVDYILGYQAGYTPVVGDTVEINPATYIIQGKVTVANSPTTPTANPGGGHPPLPTAPVLAIGSGQYRSRWQSNDVRASDSVSGAWFYGGRAGAALTGSTPTSIEIYLPLRKSLGVCLVGVHTSPTQPGGYVTASSLTPLGSRSGWVALPVSFAFFLRDNPAGGIAVTSGNGDNQWAGTQTDALSGALRFRGSR